MLKIHLHFMKGGLNWQRELYKAAIKDVEEVINTPEFVQEVLLFNYMDKGTIKNYFVDNNGMSNKQIFEVFASGADKFNTEKDSDIDVAVTLYYRRFGSAIGYTYASNFYSWLNTKFFGRGVETRALIGGNMIHEYMHNLGFSHDYYNTPTRQFSVPYAYGNIVEKLIIRKYAKKSN